MSLCDLAADKYITKGHIEHYFVTRPAKMRVKSKFENYSVRQKVPSLHGLRGLQSCSTSLQSPWSAFWGDRPKLDLILKAFLEI